MFVQFVFKYLLAKELIAAISMVQFTPGSKSSDLIVTVPEIHSTQDRELIIRSHEELGESRAGVKGGNRQWEEWTKWRSDYSVGGVDISSKLTNTGNFFTKLAVDASSSPIPELSTNCTLAGSRLARRALCERLQK